MHRDKKSAIDQREVGSDTDSFESALRRVMRQDPDVILIGEMRDETTVHTALSAAETGHLVLSTVHTLDAPETINRILDFFPPGQQQQARAMLAGTIKGIVSQRLVPRADGRGRTAIAEVLTMTGRVHDLIPDPERTGQLTDVIAEGEYYGMQTFDQALYAAVQSGEVALDDALRFATRPHDLKLLIGAEGHLRTNMEDVEQGTKGQGPRVDVML
jgi:twitching motility protein PilT